MYGQLYMGNYIYIAFCMITAKDREWCLRDFPPLVLKQHRWSGYCIPWLELLHGIFAIFLQLAKHLRPPLLRISEFIQQKAKCAVYIPSLSVWFTIKICRLYIAPTPKWTGHSIYPGQFQAGSLTTWTEVMISVFTAVLQYSLQMFANFTPSSIP